MISVNTLSLENVDSIAIYEYPNIPLLVSDDIPWPHQWAKVLHIA